jgi:hypothetical protein
MQIDTTQFANANLLKQENRPAASVEIQSLCQGGFVKNNSPAYSSANVCALDSHPIAASHARAQIPIVYLKRGEIIRLTKNSGVCKVKTKNGIVWLTGTPADGDVVLQSGEQCELRNNWPYVLEALEEVELLLVSNL